MRAFEATHWCAAFSLRALASNYALRLLGALVETQGFMECATVAEFVVRLRLYSPQNQRLLF